MTKENRQKIIFLVFALAVLITPFFLQGSYFLNVLVFVGINTMLAVALNLLLGYAGQISLGHAAFFGLGAYISGILTTRFSLDPWLVIILAAICAAGMMLENLGEAGAGKAIEAAVIKVANNKLKSLAAGKMGYSTTEVGDLVVENL